MRAVAVKRILVQSLLLIHGLSLVNQLAYSLDPRSCHLRGLSDEVQGALAAMKHQGEAEVSGELLGDAQQDLGLVALTYGLDVAH